MTLTTYKWTIEQWHRLVETGVLAGQNVELLEGEIIEMSPEGVPHSFCNQSLADYLRDLLKEKAIVNERYPITLDNSEPQPDIAIIQLPRDIYSQHHPYPENIYLLIEISNSTLQFDRTTKAAIYARNNIQEYWIVDLINKVLIVHTIPQENSYQKILEYQTGTIYSQAFPNVAIALDKLLLS
jgi:Uma2 family endonuclease